MKFEDQIEFWSNFYGTMCDLGQIYTKVKLNTILAIVKKKIRR